MCIRPIYTYVGHLEVFSWIELGNTNVPEGFLCYFNEGPSLTMYWSILELPLVVLNGSNAGKIKDQVPVTYIYESPGVPLEFSRLAVVTDQCTCQSIGWNHEHCQFEFDSNTGKTWFVLKLYFLFNLPGRSPQLK